MQIKALFDSQALQKKFSIGWGVSFLVNGHTMFDTGEKPEPLLKNMENMGVAVSGIRNVVISHDHWDHTGGLWEILKKNPAIRVYACPGFSQNFKDKIKSFGNELIESARVLKVSENIYITGEIPGEYEGEFMPEQALIARTSEGLVIMTGCAHPGIIEIIQKVERQFSNERIYMVFGGFHLMDHDERLIEIIAKEFKKIGVKKVEPCHCSGKEAERIFKKEYKNDFLSIKVGLVILSKLLLFILF